MWQRSVLTWQEVIIRWRYCYIHVDIVRRENTTNTDIPLSFHIFHPFVLKVAVRFNKRSSAATLERPTYADVWRVSDDSKGRKRREMRFKCVHTGLRGQWAVRGVDSSALTPTGTGVNGVRCWVTLGDVHQRRILVVQQLTKTLYADVSFDSSPFHTSTDGLTSRNTHL